MNNSKVPEWFEQIYKAAMLCPFYRQTLFQRVSLNHIETIWNEFTKIPLLNKQKVQQNPIEFIVENIERKSLTVEYTSGSTGVPLTCYRSKREQILFGMVLNQARIGFHKNINYERMVEFGVSELPAQNISKGRNQKLLLSACYNQSEILSYYWNEIIAFNPTFIQGFPSILSALAIHARNNLFTPSLPSLTCLESRAENLTNGQRQIIEEVFNHSVSNHYGSREFWTIAYSCDKGYLHIIPESVHVEIVSPSGNPLPDGEYGEMVVTGKIGTAMPFIRYRIGDMGRFIGYCTCGLKHQRLEVVGRSSDIIITPDGPKNRAILSTLWPLIGQITSIIQAQIEQNDIDKFQLRYVGCISELDKQELAINLTKTMNKYLGYSITFTFENVRILIPDQKTGKIKNFIPLDENKIGEGNI